MISKEDLVIFVKDDSKYNQMIDFMFLDMQNEIVSVVEKENKNSLVKLLKKIRVQKFTKGKLNFIFSKSYELYKLLDKIGDKYFRIIIIFFNSSFFKSRFPEQVLKKYKRKWKNIKYVLFYIDIVDHAVSYHANYLREKKIFDLEYTIDEKDAHRYNMILWKTPYSVCPEYVTKVQKKDLFFCGVTKNRTGILEKVILDAEKNNIDYAMKIFCKEEEKKIFEKYAKKIDILNEYCEYGKLLETTLEARCILDIVQEGQKALTLRPYEAVVYNRKLLTNNKSIFEFKYYNPNYMKYFDKYGDIDWEWVLRKEKVDYYYRGDFSPKLLIQDIKIRLQDL